LATQRGATPGVIRGASILLAFFYRNDILKSE